MMADRSFLVIRCQRAISSNVRWHPTHIPRSLSSQMFTQGDSMFMWQRVAAIVKSLADAELTAPLSRLKSSRQERETDFYS
jgi:hypothetical protein